MTHHRHRRNDQPAPRPPVALRISTEVLVALLRLDPAQHTIVGATIRQFGALQLIEFSVDAPNAPDGSVEMLPTYHHSGRPDPVSMTHVTWVDINGGELVQPLAPTAPLTVAADADPLPQPRRTEP